MNTNMLLEDHEGLITVAGSPFWMHGVNMYVTQNIHIKFEMFAIGIIKLYFVDSTGMTVPPPTNFKLVRDDKVLVEPIGNRFYVLFWNSKYNYKIVVDDVCFYELTRHVTNQKKHIALKVMNSARAVIVKGMKADAEWIEKELQQIEQQQSESEKMDINSNPINRSIT